MLLTDILGDRVRSNLVCTLVAIPWLLSPVFIALKLNGDLGDTNWGTTLTPLWLALIMTCCCLPLVVDDLDGGGCFAWMSVFTGGMCPIWVTLVLLAIRLDGAVRARALPHRRVRSALTLAVPCLSSASRISPRTWC